MGNLGVNREPKQLSSIAVSWGVTNNCRNAAYFEHIVPGKAAITQIGDLIHAL
jgi:hypothetical protein